MRTWFTRALVALALIALVGGLIFYGLSRPDQARLSQAELSGRVPVLSQPRPETVPTVGVADAVPWTDTQTPRAASGLQVAAFARGLAHPRTMLVLPNGDVLVAETSGPPKDLSGIKGAAQKQIMGKAGALVPSANRITLLRDSDGDGVADVRQPFLTGLNAPHGMVLIGSTFYVANTDALMAFPYTPGAMQITARGTKIIDLPANAPNHHWTKSLAASPDGKTLYIGVGSNSNIAEGGMAIERNRAAVLELTISTKAQRIYASGLRNAAGLAIHPRTGDLYATVNERDQLGSDMVPDYLTRVGFGEFYGWPWYYWGGFVDDRVDADSTDRREYVSRPDYALGSHVAPLGLTFNMGDALGANLSDGAFVALHGSWNRVPPAGYSVVFVPFNDRSVPADAVPMTVLDGFVDVAKQQAHGRPADVKMAKDGALLVADDVGNAIWRVTAAR